MFAFEDEIQSPLGSTAIKCSDLDVSSLSIEQIKPGNKTTLLLQRLNNKEVPCVILPKITLSSYGVPKANAKSLKTDRDRMFIQLPLEPGVTLERFELIDCTLQSEAMQQKNVWLYKYMRIFAIGKVWSQRSICRKSN